MCQTNSEHEDIKAAVKIFLDGIFENDYKKIFQIIHPKAQSGGLNPKTQEYMYMTREHWKEMFVFENEPVNPQEKIHAEVEVLDIKETAAIVRADIVEENERRIIYYTDFYSMIRTQDGWKIVNKTFHSEYKDK